MVQEVLSRNNVTVIGKGTKAIMFAHGFGGSQTMWRFITPAFEAEYRIVLFDYVGSGHSDVRAFDAQRYSSLEGYSQDVIDICTALELNQVIFVGHSVSGMVGILASLAKPALFERLILVCPSPRYVNDPPYYGGFDRPELEELLAMMEKNNLGWASLLAPTVMQNPDRPELTQEIERSFAATAPVSAQRFAEVTFFSDNRSDLPKVQVPSLIIQSREDMIAPLEVGQYVHNHLPHSQFEILETSGHCPQLSNPQETIRAIKQYLSCQPVVKLPLPSSPNF